MHQVHTSTARKVVRRSTVRVVGYHASQKMQRLVPWESQIERDFYELLEVDPSIRAFYAQPQTFDFGSFKYTPDTLVCTNDGQYFVEVKPDKARSDPEVAGRLGEIKDRLAAANIDFRLVTDAEIRVDPLRSNVRRLMRETRRWIDPDILRETVKLLQPSSLPIRQLLEAPSIQLDLNTILRFVSKGKLWLDIKERISHDTIVSVPEGV